MQPTLDCISDVVVQSMRSGGTRIDGSHDVAAADDDIGGALEVMGRRGGLHHGVIMVSRVDGGGRSANAAVDPEPLNDLPRRRADDSGKVYDYIGASVYR